MVSPLILKWQSILLVKHKEERDSVYVGVLERSCWLELCKDLSWFIHVLTDRWLLIAWKFDHLVQLLMTCQWVPCSSVHPYWTQDSFCILKHLYWARTRRSSFKNPKPNLWLSTPDFILQLPHLHEWQLRFLKALSQKPWVVHLWSYP